jgi:hypothetical protein
VNGPRHLLVATFALALLAGGAQAANLPKDTVVRIQASGIEPGWHQGRIGVAQNGCLMVFLDTKAQGGYTSVSLKGARQMQRKDGSTWVDVPLGDLAKQEPKPCQEGDND